MSSAGNDPWQPSAAKPYIAPVVPPENLPIDYSGFIAIIFGVAAAMFRYNLVCGSLLYAVLIHLRTRGIFRLISSISLWLLCNSCISVCHLFACCNCVG